MTKNSDLPILFLLPLQGLPVFAIGAGLSTFDKASVSLIIQKGKGVLLFLKHYLLLYHKPYQTFVSLQVHYYVQSHIQVNEYRDRVILVSISI